MDILRLPEAMEIENLDAPSATLVHSRIIREKPFLKNLYIDFYRQFKAGIGECARETVVELGSGGGFIKKVIPGVITSDVINLPNVDRHFSALDMPFEEGEVNVFLMIDVLHHINDSAAFFKELDRALSKGGKVIMIEPANTPWGKFVYQNFHHEPFDPSGGWGFEGEGPLSSANGAIPWIIFSRDRKRFESEFPNLKITRIQPHTPFRYLLSGGLSMRQLLPSFSYGMIAGLEKLLSPLNSCLGMFVTIELKKKG